MMARELWLRIILVACAFVLGLVGHYIYDSGYFMPARLKVGPTVPVDLGDEVHLGNDDFVNPLIDCDPDAITNSPQSAPIEEAVEEYIHRAVAENHVEEVAFHYRDLNGGMSVGINTEMVFAGASLLKVPVLIGFMKRLEVIPNLLSQTVVYDPSKVVAAPFSQAIDPPPPLVPGQVYSVNTLLARMIAYSDNTALAILSSLNLHVDPTETLQQMGVKMIPRDKDLYVTVRAYASIFRILYNSTYLPVRYSNACLEILSKTRFRDGLKRKLPADIVVAHKFGERTLDKGSQFHDCGIVYFPSRPYQICVMTRGQNMAELINVVADISGIVYERVSESASKAHN